jgi:hypothetical protein
VRVTHCFHPWFGREFEFAVRRRTWGEDWVFFYSGQDGELEHLPAGWTDVDPPDVFVAVAEGRCAFRITDLLAAADLCDTLRNTAARARSGDKEISP